MCSTGGITCTVFPYWAIFFLLFVG